MNISILLVITFPFIADGEEWNFSAEFGFNSELGIGVRPLEAIVENWSTQLEGLRKVRWVHLPVSKQQW